MASLSPHRQVEEILVKANKIIREEFERTLQYLGEECVTMVRKPHDKDWQDQTGNLRSSIGYAIYEHGVEKIRSAFQIVKEGQEGVNNGNEYVSQLARLYSSTYALVVVAAMNYAEYVEAKESRDVLASAELYARNKVDSYLDRARQRAESKINQLLR